MSHVAAQNWADRLLKMDTKSLHEDILPQYEMVAELHDQIDPAKHLRDTMLILESKHPDGQVVQDARKIREFLDDRIRVLETNPDFCGMCSIREKTGRAGPCRPCSQK